MSDTIFDKVLKKEIPSWPVWEDQNYYAFLTPFPNTPGVSVVIPKNNPGDDIFKLNHDEYTNLLLASRKVARLLEKALGVKRVALVVEGTGVPYAHVKLYPLHGKLASMADVWSEEKEYVEQYRGWITTLEGPKMDDKELNILQKKIQEASK